MTSQQTGDMDLTEEIERTGPGRGSRYRFLAVLTLVVIGAALALWGRSYRADANQPRFKTEAVRRGDLTVTVSATGTLQPTNQVEVGSELSGIVKSVSVDYNDRIGIGQELARLDDTKLKAAVAKSEAALASARASLLEARATSAQGRVNLERLRDLRRRTNGKVPSEQDIDTAEATLERAVAAESSAAAKIAEAEATLNVDRTNLEKNVIYSPINGVVLTRSVEPGQTVAASLQAPVLFTLAEDLARMELQVDVDEADVGQVSEGQEAVFTVDAYPDRSFPARIRQVRYGAATTNGVVTYKTVLTVSNDDLTLRPGMTATAEITVQKITGALLVPNAALRFVPPRTAEKTTRGGFLTRLMPRPPRPQASGKNGAGPRIWQVRNGLPVPMPVSIGQSDGSLTEVRAAGLEPGAEVIVDTLAEAK